MKSKTAMLCFLGSMFSWILLCFALFPFQVFANLEKDHWIFHHNKEKVRFSVVTTQRGLPKIKLSEIVKKFNLQLKYEPQEFSITLTNPRHKTSARFYTYSPRIEGNFFVSNISKHPEFDGVELLLPIDFGDRALRPLLTKTPPPYLKEPNLKNAVVVIDPGHGGNDWGAYFENGPQVLREKDLTLEFAKEMEEQFKKLSVSVWLTRDEDMFLTLPERTAIANNLKARFFLSIHINSSPQTKQRGFELFVLSMKAEDSESRNAIEKENQMIPENLPEGFEAALADLKAEAQFEQSLLLGKNIQKVLSRFLPPSKKSLQMGPFYVLYGAEMPSLLMELGFISNTEERTILKDKVLMKKIAQTLAKDIAEKVGKDTNP